MLGVPGRRCSPTPPPSDEKGSCWAHHSSHLSVRAAALWAPPILLQMRRRGSRGWDLGLCRGPMRGGGGVGGLPLAPPGLTACCGYRWDEPRSPTIGPVCLGRPRGGAWPSWAQGHGV